MFPIRRSPHHVDFVSGHSREHLEKTFGPYTHVGSTAVKSHHGGGFTVGDRGRMVRSKTLQRGYYNSEAYELSNKLFSGGTPLELQVPTDHMSIHVKNALGSLPETDLTSLLANEECGKKAFVQQLNDHHATWANDLLSCTPRADPRTEKSNNVAVYTAPRMSLGTLSRTLSRTLIDPRSPIVSIKTEGDPATGRPISIAPIHVEIPYVPFLLDDSEREYTLKQDAFERFASGLRVLEPSIGQELNSLLENYHEERRVAAETKIASLLEPEIETFFEYGVGEKDLQLKSRDNRSMTVGSSWQVQSVPGTPCLEATMRVEEELVLDPATAGTIDLALS